MRQPDDDSGFPGGSSNCRWATVSILADQGLAAEPHRTAKSFFEDFQLRYPGSFAAGQLRTLQRRVKEWRRDAILTFDAGWLEDERQAGTVLPGPLRALPMVVVPNQSDAAEERVLTGTGSAA